MENVSKVLDPPKMMKFEDPLPPVIIQENLSMNDSKEVQNQENVPLNPQSVFSNCVFNFLPGLLQILENALCQLHSLF